MPTSLWRNVRLFLLRWHRRLGVALAVCLLWLAVTGIALNHSVDWGLDQTPAAQPLQQAYRGIALEFTAYPVADTWVSHNGASTLYLGALEVGYCALPFSGAVAYAGEIVVACGDSLLMLTAEGQIAEQLDISYDLPDRVTGIALAGDQMVLRTAQGNYQADLDALEFTAAEPGGEALNWVSPAPLDGVLRAQLEQASYGEGVSWERALLDLHSGNFFGRPGSLLADFLALGLILLAGSGVWVWTTKPGRWRSKRRDS